jgi:RimJ/RimL family protein N-acetyltransferase
MDAQNHKFPEVIDGKFIYLRKMTVEDAYFTYQLRISDVARYLNQPKDYSLESQVEWILDRTDAEINYIIHRHDTLEQVGMVAILDVNWSDRVSSVGRLLLTEDYVKKSTPYGVEALRLTYRYVFQELKFRKITGVILGKNKKVFELQKFLGMEQEGYLKKHVILRDNYEDLYVMSLLTEDFPAYEEKIDAILNKFRNADNGK